MYPGHWSKVFPNKPAVVHASTGESVTYQQLDDRSNQLAQLMWYQGLRKGDHISIFMENNLAFFEVVWAALRSGLYLSTVNQYLTEDEAAYIVDNSDSQVLVSSNQLSAVAAKLPARCPAVKRWFMVDGAVEGYEDYSESISVHPAKNLDEEPAGTFMLYSSGTTGRPKGILKPLPSSLISDDSGALGRLAKEPLGFRSKYGLSFACATLSFGTGRVLHGRAGTGRHSGHAPQIQRTAGPAGNSGPPGNP